MQWREATAVVNGHGNCERAGMQGIQSSGFGVCESEGSRGIAATEEVGTYPHHT